MLDDIEILEKIIKEDERSGGCYISVEIPNEERQKEVKAISYLLNEYKKTNMNLTREDKENIKFALLLAIRSLNRASNKQLRLMKINKVQAIEEFENTLKKID